MSQALVACYVWNSYYKLRLRPKSEEEFYQMNLPGLLWEWQGPPRNRSLSFNLPGAVTQTFKHDSEPQLNDSWNNGF